MQGFAYSSIALASSGFIAGMAVIAFLYATHQSFGAYEGFWGLVVNIVVLVVLNPIFAKRAQDKTNPLSKHCLAKKSPNKVQNIRSAKHYVMYKAHELK